MINIELYTYYENREERRETFQLQALPRVGDKIVLNGKYRWHGCVIQVLFWDRGITVTVG